MAVTPEEVFRLQKDEKETLKEAEIYIDQELISRAASGYSRSIPVAVDNWNKRVGK